MSFNRRGGPDRRPDRFDRPSRDRQDRPPRRAEGDFNRDRPQGDWGRDRPQGDWGRDRPQGPRPYSPRPRFDRPAGDEGGMSIRLDPRRLGTLKQLAGEAGMRPGDLVRTWVEERIDAARQGLGTPAAADDLRSRIEDLARRIAALEGATSPEAEAPPEPRAADEPADAPEAAEASPSAEPIADARSDVDAEAPSTEAPASEDGPAPRRRGAKRVSATPRTERVALHDEMIAVLAERGPLTAAELASAIVERGRYTPPRSGKPLDAAMVSQRVSNPTYRSRFTRAGGRIGLVDEAP
jgi:hypothetical protein